MQLSGATSSSSSPSPPPTDAEELLQRLILEEGCASETGARPPPPPPESEVVVAGGGGGSERGAFRSRCERAELVLLYLRRRHDESREADAEQAAGEAMTRLTRAFVLLCLLRIVIAHSQRRRIIIAQWGADLRAERQMGALNNV